VLNRTGRWRYVRMAQLVWKLPTYARLIWGLARDSRTPLHLKMLLGAGLVYLVTPIDLIPDALPIIGQADDLTVLLLILDLFIANAPEDVRREHMERARNGTARLDRDMDRLRAVLGDRYDRIRDNLPELLERYGNLRDPGSVKRLLAGWRESRAHRNGPASRAPAEKVSS
jgi:uncharacterized membrane protein YkvA (DUF1232 family)